MPPGQCHVSGSVEKYNQQPLYLFTGASDDFWPSARIMPDHEGRWTSAVNLGEKSLTCTISLVAVDPNMAQYNEVYRAQAGYLNHSGMVIPKFPVLLGKITVKVGPAEEVVLSPQTDSESLA